MRKGRSLALSRTRSIGVDPNFEISFEIECDLSLVKTTSDEFFAGQRPLAPFPEERVDLAFIDGQHLVEFALRDFMNVERHALWTSVVVVDDVLPRNVREPSRERRGMVAWAGDVFKLLEIFREHRPDLALLPVDIEPTGLLVVLGVDPQDEVLAARYDEIVADSVYPDPQRVPEDVLRRKGAIDPRALLDSPVWAALRKARDSKIPREAGWAEIDHAVEQLPRLPGRELDPEQLRSRGQRGGAKNRAGRKRGRRLRRRLGRVRRRFTRGSP